MNKKILIIGDSYGLPRHHNNEYKVSEDQCWPELIRKKFDDKRIKVDTFFQRGLKMSDAERYVVSNDIKYEYIIYAGGIVDFFPRTLPKFIALSPKFKWFRRATNHIRKLCHTLGFTFTWTKKKEYDNIVRNLSFNSEGALFSIPQIVESQIINNPKVQFKINDKNNFIRLVANKYSWSYLSLHQSFNSSDFHPTDGHYTVSGNLKMYKIMTQHLETLIS